MTRRFFYHALGVGLGGRITRPFCDVIEAQAATALGTVGGYASGHVDGYRFKDIVSFRSARVYTAGSEGGDGSFNTSVTVSVEGLNILDTITADVITARLASRHGPDAAEPAISTVGTEFGNLRIGGHPVDVRVDHDLFGQERTYAEFQQQATGRAGGGAASKPARAFAFEAKGILGSLVNEVTGLPAGLALDGYSIRIPTVGTVFLGEILVTQYARRLTMVRVKLGSPVAGDLELASGEVNGSTYP